MLSPPRKPKCPFSKNWQFTLTLSTMHKMIKKSKNARFLTCLIYALFHNSRFACSIWAQERSRTPLLLNDLKPMTSFWVSIAFRMCSIFISSQLDKTSLTKPPFVRRLGFRFWNLSFNPPFNFFHVLFTDWSSTWQSGLFTGKPPWSSCSKSVKSMMFVRSFTLPAPGQTLIPNLAQAAFTHSEKISIQKLDLYIGMKLLVIVPKNDLPANFLKFR